ncbi:Transcriptional regulatory protein pro1 [Coniochaeta hoffmannii]|uniref:Transcriptional regulatory protein pro1 n=1 Tax=Coniochaeta hoffmannii TaxID=91930 RepID=A0AA38RMU6_9PEZI|nr:Transcriptional regulatory protein pro1 [Coniochaeta hoffmannii]
MAAQQLTPAKSRSSDGCWTCRLRRKKCDEIRPVCMACSALEIDCLYSDVKPEWMDGAEKQKEKADWLKLEVKRLAGARRERRHMQSLEMGMDGLEVANATDNMTVAVAPVSSQVASSSGPSVSNGTPQDSGSESWTVDQSMPSAASSTPPSSFGPAAAPTPPTLIGMQVPLHRVGLDDQDLSFMMVYLDFTFPFLFPFYRPHVLDGGRGWLLVIMMRNKALFHIALTLSAYLLSEIMKNGADTHGDCLRHNWDSLQEQQQLAMRELQADMHELNQKGVQGYLAASGQVMGSVMQLLSFEVAIANTGNWQMHLDAASVLFEQVMEHHGNNEAGNMCWHRVLLQLGHGFVPGSAGEKQRPWNPDQASLRFFTASLIFADTLSATALGRAPRLLKYHDHLLNVLDHCCEDHSTHPSVPHLKMDDFFGVPNWVLQAIAAASSLQAWKKQEKAANSLSITQLVSRAASIEHMLKTHIADLDAKLDAADAAFPTTMNTLHLFGQATSPLAWFPAQQPPLPLPASFSDSRLPGADHHLTARIWAQAAITYLLVVVSGWQPSNPEIRESVALTADLLLRRLPAPAGLRSVVWPFAVTGCLAAPGEEQGFRDLVAALGPLQIFGTVREALGLMEQVWAHRECIGALPDSWDLSVGLNGLGHPSLLI